MGFGFYQEGLQIGGTPDDGDVATVQADGSVAWEVPGGGPGGGLTLLEGPSDGQSIEWDATDGGYRGHMWWRDVTSMIGGRRCAGVDDQTTGTGTSGTAVLTLADASHYKKGHGIAVVGGGSSHTISDPANCFAIPRCSYQTAPLTSGSRSPLTCTFNQTQSIVYPPVGLDYNVELRVPDGERVRFYVTGGTLPTYDDGTPGQPILPDTDYYLRNVPEVRTVVLANTPTSGTYRLHLSYLVRNHKFYLVSDPRLYVDVPYNADQATFQAAIRTLPGCGQVTVVTTGSSPNYTHTITFTGVPCACSLVYDTSNILPITTTITITQVTRGGFSIHPTASDAQNNTNALVLDSAGSGTPYMNVNGTRQYDFKLSLTDGDGSCTQASATFSTTAGPHEADGFQGICIVADNPSNAMGAAIWGEDSSNWELLAIMNTMDTVYRVRLSASGYTDFTYSDINKTLTDGAGNTGSILCFNNATNDVWVRASTGDTFPTNGATLTTTSGTGGGTQSGAAVKALFWHYTGRRFQQDENYYSTIVRRSGVKCYPGQLMTHNGLQYRLWETTSERFNDQEISFTIDTATDVCTAASSFAGLTTGSGVYIRSTCVLPMASGGRLNERNRYFIRVITTTPTVTFSLHPTSADANANTNKIDLTADGLGTYQILDQPSYSSTVGAFIRDNDNLWRREDIAVPAQPPTSAIEKMLFAKVIDVSGNQVTIDTNLTTSVANALILHDDFDAALAHFAAAKTRPTVLFWNGKVFNFVTRYSANDSRIFESGFGGGLAHYMFRWGNSSYEPVNMEWVSPPGTKINWMPLGTGSQLGNTDTADKCAIHSFSICRPVFTNIIWQFSPLAIPYLEHGDSSNADQLYTNDTDYGAGGVTNFGARVDGPYFYGGGAYAFNGFGLSAWRAASFNCEHVENFTFYYGFGDHDYGVYVNGGTFRRMNVIRVGPDASMICYQDSSDSRPMTWEDCYLEGGVEQGFAVRGTDFRMERTVMLYCNQIYTRERLRRFTMRDVFCNETDIIPFNGTNNGSDQVCIENVTMIDSSFSLGALCLDARVNKVHLTMTARPRRITSSTYSCVSLAGTRQDISDFTVDNRGGLLTSCGSFTFAGAAFSSFTRCRVLWSRGAWRTFSVNGTGDMVFDNCEFYSHETSGSTSSLFQSANRQTWRDCKFKGRSGSVTYNIEAGGQMEFIRHTTDTGVTTSFATGITGPVLIDGGTFNGTTTIPEPSVRVIGAKFAGTATLNGGGVYVDTCDFGGTTTISGAGCTVIDTAFASAPTLSSITNLKRRGNTIAGSRVQTMTALAGNTNNYAVSICDVMSLTTSGTNNYDLTGLAGLAEGETQQILNGEASGSDVITAKHRVTSSAGNQLSLAGGADYGIDPGDTLTVQVLTAGGATYYREVARSAA